MLIYLADNRSTVINLQCVGDMHIEKSRHGWEIKCEMSSVSGFGTTTCSLGCEQPLRIRKFSWEEYHD